MRRLGVASLAVLFCAEQGVLAEALHSYFPHFPPPKTVYVVDPEKAPPEQRETLPYLVMSLSGLAARAVAQGRADWMVWLATDSSSLNEWLKRTEAAVGFRTVAEKDVWALVRRARESGTIKGYILFCHGGDGPPGKKHKKGAASSDGSVNVASSLASVLHGIIVDESLEPAARAAGLDRLADARDKSPEWCWETYRDRFPRNLLVTLSPERYQLRDYGIACGAFFTHGVGPFFRQLLAWLEPDSAIMGWNIGDEYHKTSMVSRWGHFVSPLGFQINLPVLAAARIGRRFPWESLRARARDRTRVSFLDLTWETGRHYVSFIMSDGDETRLWITSLMHDPRFWANPRRAESTMGWGAPITALAELAPAAAQHLRETIPPSFGLQMFANGYHYPDEMGMNRPAAGALALHVERLRPWAALWGVNATVSIQKAWNSARAHQAYAEFGQKVDRLLGMFAMDYDPYNAGKGRVLWVPQANRASLPVVSCRYAIWRGKRPLLGPPGRVAQFINAAPHDGEPNDAGYFDWAVIHAWSRFRDAGKAADPDAEELPPDAGEGGDDAEPDDGAGAAKAGGPAQGVGALTMCTRRLAPHVKVVKPEELLLRLRVALRTRETLGLYADAAGRGIESIARFDPQARQNAAFDEATRKVAATRALLAALPRSDEGRKAIPTGAARKAALEATQAAWRSVEQLGLASLRAERRGDTLAVSLPASLADPFCFSLKEGLELTGAPEAAEYFAADEVEVQGAKDAQFEQGLTAARHAKGPIPLTPFVQCPFLRVRAVSLGGRATGPWVLVK